MGIDLDFQKYLEKNKLIARQFQQPVNQLDGVTQSTQEPNFLQLLQILSLLERRLGDLSNPVGVMIALGDNRRLFISFGRGQQNNTQTRINGLNFNRDRNLLRMQRQQQLSEQQSEGIEERRGARLPPLPFFERLLRMPPPPNIQNPFRSNRLINNHNQRQEQNNNENEREQRRESQNVPQLFDHMEDQMFNQLNVERNNALDDSFLQQSFSQIQQRGQQQYNQHQNIEIFQRFQDRVNDKVDNDIDQTQQQSKEMRHNQNAESNNYKNVTNTHDRIAHNETLDRLYLEEPKVEQSKTNDKIIQSQIGRAPKIKQVTQQVEPSCWETFTRFVRKTLRRIF